jgi:uncharacterized membrane protein
MIPLPTGFRVWIAAGQTDMRRGMHSLALQVQALAVVFLKEPLRTLRVMAALMIVCGLMLIRLH